MVTALLCLLSILHSSGEAYNKFFSYPFDAIWVFAVDIFLLVGTPFLKVCHLCGWGGSLLTAFELPQKKEVHHLGFAGTGCGCIAGWFHCFLLLSFLYHLQIIGICLLITTCLEVCHHHFKPFTQPTVEVVTLQFGNVIWQKMFWNEAVEIWRCLHRLTPTPTLPPHPFTVEGVHGPKHLEPWHCCNVHPAQWVCHLKWCLSMSFLLTPLDSPVECR